MGSDTFTAIVKFNCNKNKHIFIYTVIERQCPDNYKSLDHFKKYHDLNNLQWTKKLSKAQYIADKREAYSPTHHGIITIDYTNAEPIEIKIMYSNELKTLTIIQSIIYSIYTFVPFLIYIIFMMKMISNLYY